MIDLINWKELSRRLAGNETSVTRKRIPKKYQSKVDDLIVRIKDWEKISQFEFAIMETITPDEATKFEPRTDVEELNELKETYAKELGYKDWETCINDQPNYKVETLMNEVALRFNVVGQIEQLKCEHQPKRFDKKHTSCKQCGKVLQMKP